MKPIRTVIMEPPAATSTTSTWSIATIPATRSWRSPRRRSEHRRSQVPGLARGQAVSEGHPILAEEDLEQLIANAPSRGRLRVQRRDLQLRDGPRVHRQRRRRRLQDPRRRDDDAEEQEAGDLVCAVRTGSGKSQTTRRIAALLRARLKVAAVRTRCPTATSRSSASAVRVDCRLRKHDCTIEEIEEYEPHIVSGTIIYAGVDYGDILAQAQEGGRRSVGRRQQRHALLQARPHIVVADPLRVGNELLYHPARRTCASRMWSSSTRWTLPTFMRPRVARQHPAVNGRAVIIEAASPITVTNPGSSPVSGARGRGRPHTHAWRDEVRRGHCRGRQVQRGRVVDPRPYTVGTIRNVQEVSRYRRAAAGHGYGDKQVKTSRRPSTRRPATRSSSARQSISTG